ncbi:hypothetical protein CSIM01_06839 [Colletotrichum simmondsii]|uniref:EF-hand domain-containing protein n=1 Tax=Colletotrichum simmondsii TaxID=703756 RepID=A0A135TF64_9PEZI|nr:hypothetical protein CSIM01_06839 [Colletotrichum simmondsii]
MSTPSAMFDMAQGRRDLAALPSDWQQNIREAWEVVDQQGLGSLNAREWPFALRAIGFDLARTETYALLLAHGVPPHDHDPSRGPCSPSRLRMPQEHFSAIAAWLLMRRDPQEEAEDAWKMFDPRGTGRVTLESLRAVCGEVNSTLSEADMRRMIDMADISGKGWVSKEEFIEVAKGGRPSKSLSRSSLHLSSLLLPQTIHLAPRQPHIGAPTRPDMPKRQRRRDLPARLVKWSQYKDEADEVRRQQQPTELLQHQLRSDRWVSQLTAWPEDEGARGGDFDGDVEEEREFGGLDHWR